MGLLGGSKSRRGRNKAKEIFGAFGRAAGRFRQWVVKKAKPSRGRVVVASAAPKKSCLVPFSILKRGVVEASSTSKKRGVVEASSTSKKIGVIVASSRSRKRGVVASSTSKKRGAAAAAAGTGRSVPLFEDWVRDWEAGYGSESRSGALSVSSGMERSISSGRPSPYCSNSPSPSPSPSPAASPRVSSAAAAAAMSMFLAWRLRPSELGCVNHHRLHGQQDQQQPAAACRPGSSRTKMRKFDGDMLASIKMSPSTSGRMFRGTWVSDEGLEVPVAIKVFDHLFTVETKKHVSHELKGKLLLRHRNLLCPLGYGFGDGKLHLLYAYMVNGSLDQHLFSTKESSEHEGLSWARRWSIINGLAAALLHLHSNEAVHGSVKSSNVLLDQDMTVRLGDFAYSRAPNAVSLSDDITCLGQPPETVTEPTFAKDVFCFGSVILEVVCARKTSHGLLDWVWDLYYSNNILEAVDKTLLLPAEADDEADSRSILLHRVLHLGFSCSHPDPSERPPMEDVVNILAGSASLPLVTSKYVTPSTSFIHAATSGADSDSDSDTDLSSCESTYN